MASNNLHLAVVADKVWLGLSDSIWVASSHGWDNKDRGISWGIALDLMGNSHKWRRDRGSGSQLHDNGEGSEKDLSELHDCD